MSRLRLASTILHWPKGPTKREARFRKPPFGGPFTLEIEGQAGGGAPDGRAADRVVHRVAAADLVGVSACTQAVVGAGALRQLRCDDIPAGPLVEPVTRADRVLAGGI